MKSWKHPTLYLFCDWVAQPHVQWKEKACVVHHATCFATITGTRLCTVAGSVKTLHLYEPRYIALLDEVLCRPGSNRLMGHVVVEQLGDAVGSRASAFPHAYVGENFVMLMGTLCRVSA